MNRQDYHDYFHNNPQGYWFKAKLYGWGWTPVTWQGWLVLGVYLVVVFAAAATIDDNSSSKELVFTFFLPIFLSTVALIRICYAKGERPSWRWGNKK